jgi:hypothetical protein
MQTKTAIKTITLYDFWVKNEFLIISTIYHVFILMFNYYAIKNLQRFEIELPHHKTKFDLIESNLEFCQAITLFTAVGIFYIKDDSMYFKGHGAKIFFMCISCFIKMSYFLLQSKYNYFKGLFLSSQDDIKKVGGIYIIIEMSYNLRIVIFLIPILFIFLFLLVGLDILFKKIKEWAKTYRIQYTEKTLIKSSEIV